MVSVKELQRYRFWQYADPHANCSEFVRAFITQFTELTDDDYPVGLVDHEACVSKHKAYKRVVKLFVQTMPQDFALACQFVGNVFTHVGVVYGGNVWHTGSQIGTVVEPLHHFEIRGKTRYYTHKKLVKNGNS